MVHKVRTGCAVQEGVESLRTQRMSSVLHPLTTQRPEKMGLKICHSEK